MERSPWCSTKAFAERFRRFLTWPREKWRLHWQKSSWTGSALKSTFYISRDIAMAILLYKFSFCIQPWDDTNFGGYVSVLWQKKLLKGVMWIVYWLLQGLVNGGIFCLGMISLLALLWGLSIVITCISGHDAGHTSLFESKVMNHIVGLSLHTVMQIETMIRRLTYTCDSPP